ncbi:MAG TPA: restriction endonuclease subunit S [Actinomycetota bacterium]|nr:restriction endonuclease subunit S [Actinomycetota bacterium]HPJ18124.1 restriction endonuclease subunit S [Actinomycetota bacterium]HRV67184.1 restriction endonuclease subunit S [Candidatus Nanopelagicales bacterium]
MGVQHVRLGDLLELRRRKVALGPSDEYVEVGLRSYGKGVFHKPAATGAQLGNKKVYRVEPGDLVISNVFAWEGALAVASESERGLIGSHRFMTWIPRNADRVNVRYLWHYFLSEPGLLHLRRASPGSAGRNRTLGISAFEDIKLPLHDLSEQQRIAARLDRIAETSQASRDLEEFELTWRHLVERLTFGSPTSLQRIGDVLRPRAMELVDRDSDYQIAGVYSFGRGLLSRGALKGADTKYKSFTRLDHNDVVYSKLGAFEGAVAVVPASYDGFYVSPEFPVFEILGSVDPAFVRYCMIAESFVRQLVAATSGVGARQKRVAPKAFLDLSVPIPSLDEQREIARRLDLASQALELKKDAVRIRKALLPAARNDAFTKLT